MPKNSIPNRRGFTLVELLVVIAIIAMLVTMLLPAVQSAREAARKSQCTNNLRQLALAFQSYHAAQGSFPESDLGAKPGAGGCVGGLYSWHARILPFIEEVSLHQSIDFSQPMADQCGDGSTGTISAEHPNAIAAATPVPVFLCPSDNTAGNNAVVMGSSNPASDNYAANAGWPALATGINGEREPGRYNGLVTLQNPMNPLESLARSPVRMKTVTDGLSKTAAISERLIQIAQDRDQILQGDERLLSFHVTPAPRTLEQMAVRCTSAATHAEAAQSAYIGRGWISGWSPTAATYRHLKTPNQNHCHFDLQYASGDFAVTPGSEHHGGVNVAMADGHVRFVEDGIEPRIWWGMGSRNGAEAVSP